MDQKLTTMGQEQIGRTLLIIGLIVIGEWSHLVQSVTTEQDLTLTAKEKRALDQSVIFLNLDFIGKPIVTANFGDWDIRKLAISGKISSLNRHIDRGFEMVTDKVRKLQESGKVVAQWDFIINMENYNLVQQGCLQCLPMYLYLVNTYENHFPAHADKIMLINTPAIFELVLNIIRPIMSPLTRQTLKVYNTNKEQWQKELFEIVDRNELHQSTVELGKFNLVQFATPTFRTTLCVYNLIFLYFLMSLLKLLIVLLVTFYI
ncbi:SEC14-like protein 5 [Orchesella cincta]|uniref:SEC14-like protein 5 n=1 Tax=Orchesella cincta TaxID=48709 RepID=A0A1D2MEX8_ORCCI|nr:SEC14-like protein 5 [Orchesella cincta]